MRYTWPICVMILSMVNPKEIRISASKLFLKEDNKHLKTHKSSNHHEQQPKFQKCKMLNIVLLGKNATHRLSPAGRGWVSWTIFHFPIPTILLFEDTMTSLLKKVEQKTGKSGTWEHFTAKYDTII